LRGEVERFRERGAELYVIGNGKPEQARVFAEEQKVNFPLYTDPSLRTYEAAGFHNGLSFSPSILWKSVKAMTRGHFQTTTQGTASQDGGVYVFDRGGQQLWSYVSKDASDHPTIDQMLEPLDKRAR
jgi:peroxiredoxin